MSYLKIHDIRTDTVLTSYLIPMDPSIGLSLHGKNSKNN